MAISFLPTSFHDSNTASDGLNAGFGGVAFLASCAKAGKAANAKATSRAPHLLKLFIFSLLIFARIGLVSGPASRPFRASLGRHTLSDGPRRQAFLYSTGTKLTHWPGSSYAGRPLASWKIARGRHGKLVVCL